MPNDQIKSLYPSLNVDETLLVKKDSSMIVDSKEQLSLNFEMNDMGEANFELGVQVLRDHLQTLLGCLKKHKLRKSINISK